MNLKIKAQVLMLICVLLWSCSDDTWNKHYEAQSGLVSNNNLWGTIASAPELSHFAGILKAHGYDMILSQSQAYTIFAPDNDALSGIDTSRMDVKTELIENHIARYFHPASGYEAVIVSALNGKRIDMTYKDDSYFYGNAPFVVPSKSFVATNGLVHILNSYQGFFPNIWEYLAKGSELDSIRNYLYSYDKMQFDQESSVPGSISSDGKQMYLDSVFINTNAMIKKLGYVNREDSSYTMLVPNNIAWNRAYDIIKNYFVYSSDSLQDTYTKLTLVKDLIFNNRLQKSPVDSLVSTSFNAFYNPQYLFDGAEKVTASNGIVYVTSDLKIDPLISWHKPIKVEAEQTTGRTNNMVSTAFTQLAPVGVTNVSGGKYLRLYPISPSSKPSATFEIPGTLSSNYDIYCVFVPPFYSSTTSKLLPSKVSFSLSYTSITNNADNPVIQRFPASGAFITNKNAMDTIQVASNFKFPLANYGETKTSVKLTVSSEAGRETANYTNQLLIDCILLKPRKQ